MEILNLPPGGYASNCYLVREGKDAVLIDCTATVQQIEQALGTAKLRAVLLTHGHFDHMLTTPQVVPHFAAPLLIHERDADFPTDGEKNAHAVFFGSTRAYLGADRLLTGSEQLAFGALSLDVTHVPGHTGGCVLYRVGNALFTGDTIFAHGYGRTDLYGGDAHALLSSLRSLEAFPTYLKIYPGHGESTSLGAALDRLF